MNIIVDDLAISYEIKGEGKPVLLLHGWKSTQEVFKNLAGELSKNYRVISLDLPGFGQSEAPDQAWGIDQYSTFLNQFLKKINRTDLYAAIAHSMSAGIAIKATAQTKIKPTKLVLIGAAGIRRPKSFRNQALKIIAKTGKVSIGLLPRQSREKLRKHLYRKIGSDYGEAGELQETFVRIVGEDIKQYARQLKQPVLLLYGEDDKETPPSYGKLLESLIPDATFKSVPQAGHYVFIDQPEETKAAIESFLR